LKQLRKIVCFGDSFAWGDELVAPDQIRAADYGNRHYREQHCYTGILADHYGVVAENLAFPGGSCQSTRWIYTWWRQHELDTESCLVLVQLSGPWRSSQFNQHRTQHETDAAWNRFAHSAWIDSYREHDRRAYQYFLAEQDLADCDDRNNLVQAETYLFFQGQTHAHPLLMFNSQCGTWEHGIKPHNLLWHGQHLGQLLDGEFWAPNKHLNEQGHQKLANMLIAEIDRVIL
jgi:hypothetical protein